MNPKITEKKWLEEFNEFVSTPSSTVPENLSKKVLSNIYSLLNPSPWLVFVKLFGIHAVVGTLSLTICDQFGLSPFNTGFSLSHYFMKFGMSVCMPLCGVLFVGLSVGLASILLSQEEFGVLRKNSPLQIFSLSIISLAIFILLGAEVTLSLAFLWTLGALVGGVFPTLVLRNSKLGLT